MATMYAACLASYNNGRLHGAHIEITSDIDDMAEQVAAMLRASPYPNVTVKHEGKQVPSAEEWAVHDWDDDTGLFSVLGETSDLKAIARIAAMVEHAESELGNDGPAIVSAYWDNMGVSSMPDDPHEAVEAARDAYAGSFDSWTDWAEQYLEDTGGLSEIPEHLRYYFDYEAYGRDANLNGDLFESNGHWFYNH